MRETYLKKNADIIIKIIYILISIAFVLPSILYLIRNRTVLGFDNYYNFFIDDGKNKILSTTIFLIIFLSLSALYLCFINKKKSSKNIKQLLIYVAGVSIIYLVMLPWHSSDIFYYMGVGELNSVYGQNPYYETMRKYVENNPEIIEKDNIMKKGYKNYWSNTTVVYGPIAQLLFSIVTKLSFKNIDFCILLFKLLNLIVHLLNCYLIYKITKKIKFSVIYGLNPYIFMEFIGMVHNDIIVVLFILLSFYFLKKKKNLFISITFLAIATGIKYFTILLLPILVLYHFRNENKIGKRILKCIIYGMLFVAIMLIEYALYYKNMNIFTAMMVQNEKLSKSIYSSLIGMGVLGKVVYINIFGKIIEISKVSYYLRKIIFIFFGITYVKFCIDLLTTKNIKLTNVLRKYNFELIIFLFTLGTFQQWYILWLFATIMWQKPNMIRNIIGISLASEIGNTIYMYKTESFVYDIFFILIMSIVFIIWKICTNKRRLSIDIPQSK